MATAKESELRVIDGQSANARTPTRREIVKRLLTGAGTGVAWPLIAASHPILEHLNNGAILAEVEKLEGTVDWKPVFLNTEQNKLLVVLAESIVPGSKNAKVSRFIDLLLSVDKVENQHKFLTSLSAHQAEAQRRFGKDFPALTDEQKFALLTDASKKPGSAGDSNTDGSKRNSTLHAHFENLKGWI